MPYIITTKRRMSPDPIVHPQLVSRRAVATLEDALRIVEDAIVHTDAVIGDTGAALIHDQEPWAWGARGQRDAITAEGGTIGPLPDGTVIEVQRVLLSDVIARVPLTAREQWPECMPTADIIDAYNATRD